LNHQRKSTDGWSIWNIILDFTGGLLSDLQLIFDCKDLHDFSAITGNFAKFGLGSISIVFDVIFMFQHYVLYAESETTDEQQSLLSEDERQANQQGSEEVEV
jgi:cystinosin